MKYHSTPKPVRIRFVSGGEEHFSLDTFLDNFNPADIIGKKNELLRWLELQGEKVNIIHDQLKDLDLSSLGSDNLIDIYNAFFSNERIGDLDSLVDVMRKKYKKNFEHLKKVCYANGALLEKFVYGHETQEIEDENHWFDIIYSYVKNNYYVQKSDLEGLGTFKSVCEIDHPKLLLKLGDLYVKRNQPKQALMLYQQSQRCGVKELDVKIKETNELLGNQSRFASINDCILIQNIIIFIWDQFNNGWKTWYQAKNDYFNHNDRKNKVVFTDLENLIIEYAFNLRKIRITTWTILDASKEIEKLFFHDGPDTVAEKILKKERDFISALFKPGRNQKEIMKKLCSEQYAPALHFLGKEKSTLLMRMSFMSVNVWEQTRIILTHLFDFE